MILPEKVRRLEVRRQNNFSLGLKDATSSIDLEKFRGYNQCKRFLTATGKLYSFVRFLAPSQRSVFEKFRRKPVIQRRIR